MAKSKKKGRDDSTKQFNIQPHPTYLFHYAWKIYVGRLYVYGTFLCYHPYFVFLHFCRSATCIQLQLDLIECIILQVGQQYEIQEHFHTYISQLAQPEVPDR